MGFLHHGKYFSYFEIARLELFRASGGDYRGMEDAGLFVVVVKAECRYRKPARFDDLLAVEVRLDRISAAKILHSYEVRRDGESLASAQVTLALVDRAGKVQPIPDWFREVY
ncbi:MAG: acyl-CoA thioesterase [Planctomycetales bacterium]|nr:acyl-CoA thioesterase [Planctomycetales bacterium]